MENNVEEQLRSTLHCDDKEKLRRKLALLQREYLRTAQRLQRAERSEAVRRHVRSRITQQNHRDPEVTSSPCLNPSPLTLNAANAAAQGPADPDNLRRSQAIRFLLPSDDAYPQTPVSSPDDTAGGHRPSPALRLRSRRSRLRWERRSAEARVTDNSEDGPDQSDKMENGRTEGEEDTTKSEEAEVVNESEELLSTSESESPSLLLTHWRTQAHTETGDMEGKETQGCDEQREKENESTAEGTKEPESTSLLLNCRKSDVHAEGSGRDCPTNGERKEVEEGDSGEDSGGHRETTLSEENSNKDMEQNAAEKKENGKSHDNTVEIKEETIEAGGKSAGLLDSCTLVEGLLFPVEYYVRTTRRMTSSQSQPNMQAVILSQLSAGRQRRSRGRGRGRSIGRTGECSDQHALADFSTLTPASVDPHKVCTVDASAELSADSQSSSEISNKISAEAFSSPGVGATPRGRGRRRKRGRGRGRTRTPRSTQTSEDPRPGVASASSSSPPSPRGPDGPRPHLAPGEPVLVPDDRRPASPCGPGTCPSPGVDGARCSPASERLQTIYPIFLKSSGRTKTSTQTSSSASCWRSLLLPSSAPAQMSSLLPLPSLLPGSLLNGLMTSDLHQDFHLPDEQFASLKLHKLRRVAAESGGVEHFASPSYNTRSGGGRRHARPRCETDGEPAMPLPLPLSLTPTIAAVDVHNKSLEEEPLNRGDTEAPGGQRTENLDATTDTFSTESVSVARERDADSLDQTKDAGNPRSQRCVSASDTHGSADHRVEPLPRMNFADEVNDSIVGQTNEQNVQQPASDKDAQCSDVVGSSEDPTSTNHPLEEESVVKTLSFDCPLQEPTKEPSNSRTASQARGDGEAPGDCTADASEESSPEPTTTRPAGDRSVESDNQKCSPRHGVRSQFLLSPPLASAPGPFTTPHHRPSAPHSSPTLPSLGLTPRPGCTGLPPTSSPSAPALALPPPHSPTTQALSPPTLSPCPSVTSLPPSRPLVSPSCQNRASLDPSDTAGRCDRVEPVKSPAAPSIQSRGTAGQEGRKTEASAEHGVMGCTHTLKAPAGGCLVDACCLPGPSGGLCVAAAGKWAVCLWSQTPPSDWSLAHTWTFNDPVINVFPVPDAAGLLFVTLGQLEIREVRTLSCCSLVQVLLCEGVVQAVVGVSGSRVVTSSHSATASTLRVFNVSDDSSTPSSLPLVSPGVCVGALAPVDGLPDALIGSDEGGRVFVWNLKSGQLLRTIVLCDGLSHTACLRGYSYCGVLFVLLQHQLLSSLEEEEKAAKAKEEERSALFSLVAVNPLSSRSVLATRLYPPTAWSGRLCEADVNSSGVVGLSQSGRACVWELGRPGATAMVRGPEGEGWQLARWGGADTLVTGHHNGDVTLHRYSKNMRLFE
ncbi:partner and localizer of BRCA2 [Scophthalmus maximus]|uniref:partner and localizer of BRCA2 n=1 Tax=Scophthalmus maximus TaxID=52904 RepID=UPI001FA91691|nr:partner and localizer of BRCA2 [Scophthalmus maximus]